MAERAPLLPLGTHVVTRVAVHTPSGDVTRPAGAVGVIVHIPVDAAHTYRVRFPDGTETSFARRELSIRREERRASLQASDDGQYEAFVELRVIVGSRAFGLADENSDTDRRGFYVPPASAHWSLWGVPEQLENHETQESYWELQKFLALALKANPNVLECLYTPLVEHTTPLANELLALRGAFLSRLVYQTYNGYVLSQFKKLEADVRQHGAPRAKHVMHLLRLLISGISVLKSGEVLVDVGAHREQLLTVKRGELPWNEVDAWRLRLHREFDEALVTTKLPNRPDYARVNDFLLRARRSRVDV